MAENDVELRVGLAGQQQAKAELKKLTDSVEQVGNAGVSVPSPIDATEVQAANDAMGAMLADLGNVATLASIPVQNVRKITKVIEGLKLITSDLGGVIVRVSKGVGAMIGLLTSPIILSIAGIVLGIKLAYDKWAESIEKVARAQQNANEQTRIAMKLVDDARTEEEKRIDSLAETEALLISQGQRPSPQQVENTAAMLSEAMARTGQAREKLAPFAGFARSADDLIRASGFAELDEGSFLRRRGMRSHRAFMETLDTSPEQRTRDEATIRALNAKEQALQAELDNINPFTGAAKSLIEGFTFGTVFRGQHLKGAYEAARRRELAGQIIQIQDLRNSINFNAPDGRKRAGPSHVEVP